MKETERKEGGNKKAHPAAEACFKADGLVAAIVTPRDDAGNLLIRELQRLRVETHYFTPSTEPLPTEADIVYCDYSLDLAQRIPWLIGESQAALVVILPQTSVMSADALLAVMPNAVLARPFTANAIIASLMMARTQLRYEQRLRDKVDRLEDNMRSMRTVERAKAMLMSSRGFSDAEAYKHIRSLAMARRISVSSLAAAIVSSFEILGDMP